MTQLSYSDQKPIDVAVGVIINADQHVLIAKRAFDSPQGGLWEFPGGKIESGETAIQTLVRELREELNIEVKQASPFIKLSHDYGDYVVTLHVFIVSDFQGEPIGRQQQPLQWISIDALAQFAFPDANQAIIKQLNATVCQLKA